MSLPALKHHYSILDQCPIYREVDIYNYFITFTITYSFAFKSHKKRLRRCGICRKVASKLAATLKKMTHLRRCFHPFKKPPDWFLHEREFGLKWVTNWSTVIWKIAGCNVTVSVLLLSNCNLIMSRIKKPNKGNEYSPNKNTKVDHLDCLLSTVSLIRIKSWHVIKCIYQI